MITNETNIELYFQKIFAFENRPIDPPPNRAISSKIGVFRIGNERPIVRNKFGVSEMILLLNGGLD